MLEFAFNIELKVRNNNKSYFSSGCNHLKETHYVLFIMLWILTGFHHFTEIGQIFYSKYIFNNRKHFPSWNLGNILTEWCENPGKGTLRVKNQNISWGSLPLAPRTALDSVCAFGPRLGNRSVFILDPRLRCKLVWGILANWSNLNCDHLNLLYWFHRSCLWNPWSLCYSVSSVIKSMLCLWYDVLIGAFQWM